MLSKITITCFAASYAVALVLEVLRARIQNIWLKVAAQGFLFAGLFAQSVYLVNLAKVELSKGILFASWYDWCLLAAWFLVATCLGLSLRKIPLVGLFMLPLVLVVIAAAWRFQDAVPFERTAALRVWGMIHGIALLIGSVGVAIGFSAGLMYLLQSYRLKHKIPTSSTFKLPSLEWLQRLNIEALLISSFLIAVGLLTGVVMNAIQHIQHIQQEISVAWTEPTVLGSAALLLWLIAMLLFNWLYKPARQGRKVAYMTLASFGFLSIVLGLVLFSQHASGGKSHSDDHRIEQPSSRSVATAVLWEDAP